MAVFERVQPIVVDHLGVRAEAVTEDARLEEDLDADSLDKIELVMALEEEFGISIPDDELAAIKTVGEAVRLIEGKLG